jgi:hypothetical protein
MFTKLPLSWGHKCTIGQVKKVFSERSPLMTSLLLPKHWSGISCLPSSSHKSLVFTSSWVEIDVADVIACHTPMCKTHRDMTWPVCHCLERRRPMGSRYQVDPSQESNCDCMTRDYVRMSRTIPPARHSDIFGVSARAASELFTSV